MHAQCAIRRMKSSGGRLRKKWKPCARPSSRKTRIPLATSSEPASTFGQRREACTPPPPPPPGNRGPPGELPGAGRHGRPEDESLHPDRRHRLQRLVDLVEPEPVLGR